MPNLHNLRETSSLSEVFELPREVNELPREVKSSRARSQIVMSLFRQEDC